MSIYKGRFQQVETPKGKFEPKKKLSVQISPITVVGNVRIRCINALKGEMERQGTFGGSVKRLSVRYVFLAAVVRFFDWCVAVLGTAPAKEMESDTAIQASKEAPLSADPVAEVKVNGKIRFSVLAGLVAYARAPFRHIRDILMHHVAGLTAADSAVAKFAETMKVFRKSVAEAVKSAIAESRFNSFTNDHDALGSSAPTVDIPAVETSFTTADTATGSTGTAADVGVQDEIKMATKAGLFTWFLPEYEDGALTIFQVFSGVQSADTVEVDLEEDSVYWANNINQNGVLSLVFAQTDPQTENELKVI